MADIEFIDPGKMRMDDGSEWQFFPATSLLVWKVGDKVDIKKGEGRFSLYRATNSTRKEEAGVVPISTPGGFTKTLGDSGSEVGYTNLNSGITIKNASGELICLRDGSKWQMYNPALGNPGSWEIGDTVIVTYRVAKSLSKTYEMQNVKTGITLIAIFLGYE